MATANTSVNDIADWFGLLYKGYSVDTTSVGTTNVNVLRLTQSNKMDFAGIFIYIAFVLALITWVILYTSARDIDVIISVGNRVQQECGKSYMEIETARYKLYNEYVNTISKNIAKIKKMLMVAFLFVIIGVIGIFLQRWWPLLKVNGGITSSNKVIMSSESRRTAQILAIIVSVVILILFVIMYSLTSKMSLENKYSNTDKDNKKNFVIVISFVTIIIVGVIALLSIILWLNSIVEQNLGVNNKNYVLFFSILVVVIVLASLYAVNIGTNKINNEFISPYGSNAISINKSIMSIKDANCNDAGCVIQNGPDSGISVNEWMKITLARNIKRMNPEEKGDPELILNSRDVKGNKYSNSLYGYIENEQGRELAEIPNTKLTIRRNKDNIRQKMWENRRNNNDMLKSAKQFVRTVYAIVFIVFITVMFLLFHSFYMNFPAGTTVSIVLQIFTLLAIVAVVCWLMASIVYR